MFHYFWTIFNCYCLFSLVAVGLNYNNKRQGLKGIPYKDCLNPLKWISVAYGYLLKFLIPPHVFEQYVLRMYDTDCQPCIKQGKCIGGITCGSDCACGCDTIAKMYSPIEKDSAGNWGPIVYDKKVYNELREKYPVKIEITYNEKVRREES